MLIHRYILSNANDKKSSRYLAYCGFIILLLAIIMSVVNIVSNTYFRNYAQDILVSDEAESGLVFSPVVKVADNTASGGQYIFYSSATTPSPTLTPVPGGLLAAFPGAAGFGLKAWQNCDRSNVHVLHVTNLNVSGTGSFANAIAASGPRVVVFDVGGTIDSSNSTYQPRKITVTNPCIYIAGQTAPGDGIMLKGITLNVNTHDAIVRGLRIRVGDEYASTSLDGGSRDSIQLETNSGNTAGIFNVIVDHNSASWATDEIMSTWTYDVGSGPPIHDVTFSWNLMSEGLYCSINPAGCHSKGLLIGDHTQRATVHHNLYIHNSDRAPEIKGDVTAENINNVTYNYKDDGFTGGTLIGTWEDPTLDDFINVIGNYYIKGVNWSGHHEIGFCDRITQTSRVYIYDNIGPFRTSSTQDQWAGVENVLYPSLRVSSIIQSAYSGTVPTEPSGSALLSVLNSAGAIVPKRDTVDTRVVQYVRNTLAGSGDVGHIINSQTEVGGWPVMNSGIQPQDSDGDGMPDSWENSHGGNLNPNTIMSSGYTAIEEYVNSLIPV